jgi:hypothetical protein
MNVKAIFEFYRCFNMQDGKASMLHLSGWKAIFHNCSHCASLYRKFPQAVIVEAEKSTYLPVDSGVLQGSVL